MEHKIEYIEKGWKDGCGWTYTTDFERADYTEEPKEKVKGRINLDLATTTLAEGEDVLYQVLFDGEPIFEIWQSKLNEIWSGETI